MKKYTSPFPDRKLTGQDFCDLVDHINIILEKSDLSEERINELLNKLEDFDKKNEAFGNKLENFYSKQIQLFGLFIAIFSFIIAGIQISSKAEGTFFENLSTSVAIFFPITFCIIILYMLMKSIIKK